MGGCQADSAAGGLPGGTSRNVVCRGGSESDVMWIHGREGGRFVAARQQGAGSAFAQVGEAVGITKW